MKKFFAIAMMAFALMACGSKTTENATNTEVEMVATEIVPAAATEVLPCAAPGPDAGGQVATDVIPAE